jgi:hypothetical protein
LHEIAKRLLDRKGSSELKDVEDLEGHTAFTLLSAAMWTEM